MQRFRHSNPVEVKSKKSIEIDKSGEKNGVCFNVAKTEFRLIGSHHKLNNLDSQPSGKIGCDRLY